jgi:hypothetical protein
MVAYADANLGRQIDVRWGLIDHAADDGGFQNDPGSE